MSRADYESIPQHDNIETAKQLALIISRLSCFEDVVKTSFDNATNQLVNNRNVQFYLNTLEVKSAFDHIKTQQQYLLPALFRIWYQQTHRFSYYEKIFFTLSSMTLIAAAILSHEIFIIFSQGKPLFRNTGNAMKDYCTGGLTNQIINTCASLRLKDNAIFDFNFDTKSMPNSFSTKNHLPVGVINTVKRWINPIAWIDFFTCEKFEDSIQLIAHAYHNSLTKTLEKASQGFPILDYQIPLSNTSSIIRNITLFITTQLFLAEYCVQLQDGGYSTIRNQLNQTNGHFNGFESFADDFEKDSYTFAVPYFIITGFACLTMGTLLSKAAMSKWHDSCETRQQFFAIREANALIEKLEKTSIHESPIV